MHQFRISNRRGVLSDKIFRRGILDQFSKTPPQAVDQGFKHAWVTIIDTHVTTIVSAIILFLFGTGPVRGFAVTLSFGLAANLFTSVFVSRVIFDAILNRHQRGEALSI